MGWEGDYHKRISTKGGQNYLGGGGGRLIMVIGMSGVQFSV